MNTDDLARFLRANPQFFDQNPELLESLQVPHPHGGRAIPLAETIFRYRSARRAAATRKHRR